MVAEGAVLAHHGVGVGKKMAACLNTGVKDDVRQQGGVRPETHSRAYDDVCADVCTFADFGGGVEDAVGWIPGGYAGGW